MDSFFSGQGIFLTGCTGFVGKVLLEKLLRDSPELGAIYVLVRPKKGVSPHQRVKDEILSSACFDVLRGNLGAEEFEALATEKVIPVEGDMQKERLGMTDEDYKRITEKVHVIVHMAATVNFTERLDLSVELNILATLRMVALAKHCMLANGRFRSFVHVSTCYVNCNQPDGARISESIYPLNFDVKSMIAKILDMAECELEEFTDKFLADQGYPNTYALTKSMTEHMLMDVGACIPLSIFRPSIVGAALKEPFPGWTDTLTAAGGMFIGIGAGILKEAWCLRDVRPDLVPVDFVVNMMIRCIVKTAELYEPMMPDLMAHNQAHNGTHNFHDCSRGIENISLPRPRIYHCGTTDSSNECTWMQLAVIVQDFWKKNPLQGMPAPTGKPALYENYWSYRLRFLLKREIPVKAMELYATLPFANEKLKAKIPMFTKALDRHQKMTSIFTPFMTKGWVFEMKNDQFLLEGMTDADKDKWYWDRDSISWRAFLSNYCWGMTKYVLKKADLTDPPIPIEEFGSTKLHKSML